MPAVEVEIGEKKHHQCRRKHRLGAGAPNSVGGRVGTENLVPEAEIDTDIREHGPSQRRRRREDDGSLDDEHNGQEQRQQAGNADHYALVKGQAGDFFLIGVWLPQIELRQMGCAQFGDIGDGRAGVEGEAEHVGVGTLLALGRKALARGDGGNAGGAEIRPDQPRILQAKMRRDDQSFDLLVGVVGEREHDPARMRARLLGLDLDAARDPVRARRGRNLQPVAFRSVFFDRVGEVDRRSVVRHAHAVHRPGRGGEDDEQQQRDQILVETHEVTSRARRAPAMRRAGFLAMIPTVCGPRRDGPSRDW